MSERSFVGAIDQGTTGTRFIVFDQDATIVGRSYERHEQHYPQPGWVEHDPQEIWDATLLTITQALENAGISAQDLAAIGVTNQRETTVLWDGTTGIPIHNAIVWQDRRTADRIDDLEERGLTDEIIERTGLQPDAYFSATKLEWLLEHADFQTDPADLRFGTIDSWLIERLTGEHVTDTTNASRTMLFDIDARQWDPALLDEFDVPESVLPRVEPSVPAEPYGVTDPDGPLEAAVPVAAALGDQQAALFGQACFEAGEAKNTYGTGSFLLLNTGQEPVRSDHGLLTTVAADFANGPTTYALEGAIFVTGAALEWLTEIELINDPAETEQLARSVTDSNGVYLVPAFTGLGAPHWDQRARGSIIGLTRDTSRAHLARAALEAIAFQTRDVSEAMTADAGTPIRNLRVDGGAVQNDMLCSIQADILDTEVHRAAIDESTALGAATAAGLAVGVWDSREDLRSLSVVDERFEPTSDSTAVDRRYDRWLEAVDRSRDWATPEDG